MFIVRAALTRSHIASIAARGARKGMATDRPSSATGAGRERKTVKNCEECGWPEPCDCEPERSAGSLERAGSATCHECGGSHEPSGARSDCIHHWKQRALAAENDLRVMPSELRAWLDQKTITSENIGDIRRQCFMPWGSGWNALVRDETAAREKSPNDKLTDRGANNQ